MDESCCVPLTKDALTASESIDLANIFKALGDPVRLRVLSLVASVSEGEVCACDLNEPLDRSQATISHHLSILVKAGLITRQQRGKWAWFQVAADRAEFVKSALGGQPAVAIP